MTEFKKKRTLYQQKCIDLFGDDLGSELSKFYRDCLDFGGSPTKIERERFKKMSLSDRRIAHMQHITKTYKNSVILNAINDIRARMSKGIISTKLLRPTYFEKVLESCSVQPSYSRQTHTDKSIKLIVPVKNKKIYSEYDKERLNWDWKCECGCIFDGWTEKCPSCGVVLFWENIKI